MRFKPIPLLIALPLLATPRVPSDGQVILTPEQTREALTDLALRIPFQKSKFSIQTFFEALHVRHPDEDAEPLLPAEFLALPIEARAHALHPDTTCLLAMMIARAAARAWPKQASEPDWMVPVLIRAQTLAKPPSILVRGSQLGIDGWVTSGNPVTGAPGIGRLEGPSWPLVEYRQNLPSADPRVGLDKRTRLVGPDRASRIFELQHSGGAITDFQAANISFAPEMHFASNDTAVLELENWILARILVARARGSWDPSVLRASFLALAAPRIPVWDPGLAKQWEAARRTLHSDPPKVPQN